MKNKCTLLIDGNWLLQSRFSVIGKGFEIDMPKIAREKSTNDLVELMAKSINVMLNKFPSIDNILLVTDGGSWRKHIEKPKTRKNVEYKGNRETQEKYDWDSIWAALKILSNNFVKYNITYSCSRDIEGDDWIWHWSDRLNKEGINCIIWSSDNDLKQLVKFNESSGAFTMWYNDKHGGVFHQSLKPEEDAIDFFMKPMIFNQTLEEIKKSLRGKMSYIYPSDIILSKIICGDSGDNIKPVASYESNGRTYNITERMWKDISDYSNIASISSLIGNENTTADFICEYKKFKSEGVCKEDVLENILYNTKMVWLDESIIPSKYKEIMDKCEYKVIDIKFIKNNFKVLCNTEKEIEEIYDEIEKLFD